MGLLYFNFEEWIKCKDLVVHCKTIEEAADFIEVLKENNWRNKITDAPSHKDYLTYWYEYKENTCYNFRGGCYGRYDYFKKHDYTILEWSDYMREKKTIKDILQPYDIVTLRNHTKYMYMPNDIEDIFVNSRDWLLLQEYDDDLKINYLKEFDIMEIARPTPYQFRQTAWNMAEVIWTRPEEVEEMTLEEVCAAFGKEIKIVKSKEN